MAVVATYYPAKNVIVRIHNDACILDPMEIQRTLDDIAKITNKIIMRKLREGVKIKDIFGKM